MLFSPNPSSPHEDFITKMMERDPKGRLGSSANDVKDNQRHAFFKQERLEQAVEARD